MTSNGQKTRLKKEGKTTLTPIRESIEVRPIRRVTTLRKLENLLLLFNT